MSKLSKTSNDALVDKCLSDDGAISLVALAELRARLARGERIEKAARELLTACAKDWSARGQILIASELHRLAAALAPGQAMTLPLERCGMGGGRR